MKIEITKPESSEIETRILKHFELAIDQTQMREIALTWDGYIAAMLEWGLISPEEHSSALALLRGHLNKNDPSIFIFTGVPEIN